MSKTDRSVSDFPVLVACAVLGSAPVFVWTLGRLKGCKDHIGLDAPSLQSRSKSVGGGELGEGTLAAD